MTEGVGSVHKARGTEREKRLHVGEGELLAIILMLDDINFLSNPIRHRKELNKFVDRIDQPICRIALGVDSERRRYQNGGGKGRLCNDMVTQPTLYIYRTLPYERTLWKADRIQYVKYHEQELRPRFGVLATGIC